MKAFSGVRMGPMALISTVAAGTVFISGISAESLGAAQGGRAATVRLDQSTTQSVASGIPSFSASGPYDNRGNPSQQMTFDYFGFINAIRSRVHDYNNVVEGTSDTVEHTSGNNWQDFFYVDVANSRGHTVRLQLNAGNLYLVGWFTGTGDVYNYVGPMSEANVPLSHRGTGLNWQLNTGSDYRSIESDAHNTRGNLLFSRGAFDNVVETLWRADNPREMNVAVLWMTQFISEAVRSRGIADTIGWDAFAPGNTNGIRLDRNLIGQETDWGQQSARFNAILGHQPVQGDPPTGWYRNTAGRIVSLTLISLVDYARVWLTVNGHPSK